MLFSISGKTRRISSCVMKPRSRPLFSSEFNLCSRALRSLETVFLGGGANLSFAGFPGFVDFAGFAGFWDFSAFFVFLGAPFLADFLIGFPPAYAVRAGFIFFDFFAPPLGIINGY